MCKTIKQKVKFKAPPKEIFDLLADGKKHAAFTGEKAVISKKVGGAFSHYSGYIKGINVDLQPGKRLVLAWRGSDFPEGVFSMATFLLNKTADGGTELILIHRGVPKDLIPGIEKGWKEFYWEPMKDYLAQR